MLLFPLCAEIARQAAQMKLMRKLEKQALARAAKEARKQQGKKVRGYKHASTGYSLGQSVTSKYFDLNDHSMKTSGTFMGIHAALTAFVISRFLFDFITLKCKL